MASRRTKRKIVEGFPSRAEVEDTSNGESKVLEEVIVDVLNAYGRDRFRAPDWRRTNLVYNRVRHLSHRPLTGIVLLLGFCYFILDCAWLR